MSKKRVIEGIAIFFASFLITSFVNFFINYATSSSGEITKGAIVQFDDSSYYSLEIVNHSNKSLNDLRVSVPDGFSTNRIRSNLSLKFELEESTNSGDSKLSISGIEPESKYLLLLPVQSSTSSDLSVLNNQEFGIGVKEFGSIDNPQWEILKSVAIDALVYSVVVFIGFIFISSKIDKTKSNLAESRKTQEKLLRQIEDALNKSNDALNMYRRVKTLMIARISDYSKELEFWRNTIRKILISDYDKSEDSVEDLLQEISKSLNTQRTLAMDRYNFDEIEVMVNLLKKEEK